VQAWGWCRNRPAKAPLPRLRSRSRQGLAARAKVPAQEYPTDFVLAERFKVFEESCRISVGTLSLQIDCQTAQSAGAEFKATT